VWEEFRISISKQTMSRELRALGYRKLSARPRHHAQAEGAIDDFKNVWPAPLQAACRSELASLRQRIRPGGVCRGQDGDPRVSVLIKTAASSGAIF
jgi:hypothetical protein